MKFTSLLLLFLTGVAYAKTVPLVGTYEAVRPRRAAAVTGRDRVFPLVLNGRHPLGPTFQISMTLINTTGEPADVSVSFFDGQAEPYPVAIVGDNGRLGGRFPVLAGRLDSHQTGGFTSYTAGESTLPVYAVIHSEPEGAVQAMFTQHVQIGGVRVEVSSVPSHNRNQGYVLGMPTPNPRVPTDIYGLNPTGETLHVSMIARQFDGTESCRVSHSVLPGQMSVWRLSEVSRCIASLRSDYMLEVSSDLPGLHLATLEVTANSAYTLTPLPIEELPVQ